MSFFAILFALLIEQVRPLARQNPVHAGLRQWARWVSRNFDAGKSHHGWVCWSMAVLLPTVATIFVALFSSGPLRANAATRSEHASCRSASDV